MLKLLQLGARRGLERNDIRWVKGVISNSFARDLSDYSPEFALLPRKNPRYRVRKAKSSEESLIFW